mmetsp:Transcript_111098/g.313428  ORF Transcript_111098/g.313428 Transcript_111098/m.313428 type:complete len:110 (-) Transcript_111098:324-653(-)
MPTEGGDERYTWSQSEADVTIKVPVPGSSRREDVQFKVLKGQLKLTVAGDEVCCGELAKEVDPEECSWVFERDGESCTVVVSLHKVNRTALKSARHWPSLWKEDDNGAA